MTGSVDGEVRTIQAAKIATATFFSSYDVWWVISLGIERGGERKHARGAKLDAEAASLAAFDGDEDRTFCHLGGRCARRWPQEIRPIPDLVH
jgi:hypothetical protein